MIYEIYETPEGRQNTLTITPDRVTINLSPDYKKSYSKVKKIYKSLKIAITDNTVKQSFIGTLQPHELDQGFTILFSDSNEESLHVIFGNFGIPIFPSQNEIFI